MKPNLFKISDANKEVEKLTAQLNQLTGRESKPAVYCRVSEANLEIQRLEKEIAAAPSTPAKVTTPPAPAAKPAPVLTRAEITAKLWAEYQTLETGSERRAFYEKNREQMSLTATRRADVIEANANQTR